MKYLASNIVNRALKLADVANTDFIGYDEQIQYLNDSFKDLFQVLINKGDSQFVKEVELGGAYSTNNYAEYELPWDLYRIKCIQDKYSGREILRKATTESINSGTYDIVNDKLRIYGFSGSHLMMTYYITPPYLSYPNKSIDIDEVSIVSTAKNSALIDNGDGTLSVVNLLTKDVVSTFEWADNTDSIVLGNGHFFYDNKWYNFRGEEIGVSPHGVGVVYDDKWNILSYTTDLTIESRTTVLKQLNEDPIQPRILYDGNDIGFYGKKLYVNQAEVAEMDSNITAILPTNCIFNDCKVFIIACGQKLYYALFSPLYTVVSIEEIELYGQETLWFIDYGPIVSDGTFTQLLSWVPDTLMNFPNELYFSVMSADLAVKYAMKANADTGSLDNLYQKYYNQFMNSLSQAAGYTRIKNAYR